MKAAVCDITFKEIVSSGILAFWKSASEGVLDFHWKHFQRGKPT